MAHCSVPKIEWLGSAEGVHVECIQIGLDERTRMMMVVPREHRRWVFNVAKQELEGVGKQDGS